MSRRTVDAVKALIQRRTPDLSVLSLSWFGGEPLVARDILQNFLASDPPDFLD
jgi:uncharacterized protein